MAYNQKLSSLTIDRADRASKGRKLPFSLAIFALLILALLVWSVRTLIPKDQPQIVQVSDTSSTTTAPAAAATPSPSAPAAAPVDGVVLDASGYVVARRLATVSAEITGKVIDVLVEEGDEVSEGQVVARMDAAIARVNLQLAEAQVDVQKARAGVIAARLEEARRVLARTEQLATQEFSSKANLTAASAEVKALSADLTRAEADVTVAEYTASRNRELLADHTIRAPFSGVVVAKNAQPGEIVAPGSAGGGFTRTGICTLVDMASLEIEVDVNESYLARVVAGQPVIARLDAYPDWQIPAEVIAIVPTANRDKATVRVRVGLLVRDTRILPDMGVKVAFMEPGWTAAADAPSDREQAR